MLRISKDNRKGDVHKIPLTNRQINKINKAKNAVILSLSSKQLKYFEKSGDLLLLLGLLPLIFGGLGAAGAVAGEFPALSRLLRMLATLQHSWLKRSVTIAKLSFHKKW